jgi:hypothetical protein
LLGLNSETPKARRKKALHEIDDFLAIVAGRLKRFFYPFASFYFLLSSLFHAMHMFKLSFITLDSPAV